MHYVIYPDTLFMENFICNLLFLTFLKSLFFTSAKAKRIFLAAAMTALCNTLASILFFRCIWVLQIAGLFPAAGIMVCYGLEMKDKRRILYLLYQMVLWTFVIGGMIQMLGQVVLSVALSVTIFGILEKVLRMYKRQNTCMREVILHWRDKSIRICGFADTGNHLMDPVSKKAVSIITSEAWHTLLKETEEPMYRLIPYKAVGKQHGLLQGIQIDYMVILEGDKSRIVEKPMIAITEQPFTGIFHYSILLHSEFCSEENT